MTTATETAAPQAASAWQAQILDQLDQADTDEATHAVITRDGDEAQLVDVAESEQAAIVVAEDWTAKRPDDEFTIVKLAELTDWADANGFADRPAGVDPTPDADKGQLFPQVKIAVDAADPTLLHLAFSGAVPIERDNNQWVEFYNRLKAGKTAELRLTVHVAGTKNRHRRDKEGNVDAVVQTKSLTVTDVHLEGN